MVCYRSVEWLIFLSKLPAGNISIDLYFAFDKFMIWDRIRHIFCEIRKVWNFITQLFGTDPDQNGVLEGTPRSWTDSYSWLSHLGVRAPCATLRKRRYEANQVWLNTIFISQGSQSRGKLAVETWRVKTELIIITILHIIIIITSILNLGFKTIAPKLFAHIKMHK